MLLYTIQAIYTEERVRVHLECRHKWPQNSQNKWIYLSIILLSQYIFVPTVHISPSSYMPCIRATTTAVNQPEKWTQQLLKCVSPFRCARRCPMSMKFTKHTARAICWLSSFSPHCRRSSHRRCRVGIDTIYMFQVFGGWRERKFDQNRAFVLIYNAALVAFHLSRQRVRNWFNSAKISMQNIVALTACITYSRHDKCCLNMPRINMWALSWTWIYIFINSTWRKMYSTRCSDLICLSLLSLVSGTSDTWHERASSQS